MASIRSSQTGALERMLDLNKDVALGAGADDRAWHDPWKVLVYDSYCRDIISPLLTVGDLRKRGITLYLLLDSDREVIGDVPAIYFMQPTMANVKRLGVDTARGLYESYYVNFTPAVPRPLLEELAASTLETDSVAHISRVMDQYLNFASVEEDFFSLLLPQSYVRLHDPRTKDTDVEATLDAIVQGLFSAVVTLGSVPILRYKTDGGPAQMVAEALGRRLHDQLKAHPALFAGDSASAGFQRPLLVITERATDFSVRRAPLARRPFLAPRTRMCKTRSPQADTRLHAPHAPRAPHAPHAPHAARKRRAVPTAETRAPSRLRAR